MSNKPATEQLYQIVMPLPGHEGEMFDDCPICRTLAAQGVERYATGADGSLEPLPPPEPVATMLVGVSGDFMTRSVFGPPADVEVARGCRAGDFLEYVCFIVPALLEQFPPGALGMRVNGARVSPDFELHDRDEVTLTSNRAPVGSLW